MAKDIVLISCHCGKVYKHGSWIFVPESITEFVRGQAKDLGIIDRLNITFFYEECPNCRANNKKELLISSCPDSP